MNMKAKSLTIFLLGTLISCNPKSEKAVNVKKTDVVAPTRFVKGSEYSRIAADYKGPANFLKDLQPEEQEVEQVAVTGDGKYVYFVSSALSDSNHQFSVYRRAMVSESRRAPGPVELISYRPARDVTLDCGTVSMPEVPADGDSSNVAVSYDGRYVAFISTATNLTPSAVCDKDPILGKVARMEKSVFGGPQVYLMDTVAKNIVLVSGKKDLNNNRWASEWVTNAPIAISGDGNVVAYISSRSGDNLSTDGPKKKSWFDLESDNPKLTQDIFVYNRTTEQTAWVSFSGSAEVPIMPDGDSVQPSLSYDGRYLAFTSSARLSAADKSDPGVSDVYRAEFKMSPDGPIVGKRMDLKLVSTDKNVPFSTAKKEMDSYQPSMSADGRYIAFTTNENPTKIINGWTPGDIPTIIDGATIERVVLRDMDAGKTSVMSVAQKSSGGRNTLEWFDDVNAHAFSPSISPDGDYLMYTTTAGYLVSYDKIVQDYFKAAIVPSTENSCRNLTFANRGYDNSELGGKVVIGGWDDVKRTNCLPYVDPKGSNNILQTVLVRIDKLNLKPGWNNVLSLSQPLLVNHFVHPSNSCTKCEFDDIYQLMYGDRNSNTEQQSLSDGAKVIAFTSSADNLLPPSIDQATQDLVAGKASDGTYRFVPNTDVGWYISQETPGAIVSPRDPSGLYFGNPDNEGMWRAFTYNVYENPVRDPAKKD